MTTGSTDSTPSVDTSGKLASGSIYTKADQERWYREMMGERATQRQKVLARLDRKQCVCDRPKVTWMDAQQSKTTRILHRVECPKHRAWMTEFLPPLTQT